MNDTHGAGGSYRINKAGERELVERTKSIEEAEKEKQGAANSPAATDIQPATTAPAEAQPSPSHESDLTSGADANNGV